MSVAHRNAKSAWSWLVKFGGIELEGRDSPLVEMLKSRLNPESVDLDDALTNTTVTGFVNAFFGVITPFVGMMRDLLEYFEEAGANEGPVNWVLVLGEEDEELEVNLDAFRQWIKTTERIRPGARMVPILAYSDLWELRKHFYPTRTEDPNQKPDWDFRQPEPRIKDRELTNWLAAYGRGEYLDLPRAVNHSLSDPGPVGDVAALLTEIYSAIRTIAGGAKELSRKWRADDSGGDFWSAAGLGQFESDLWVRGRVLDLAAYEQATPVQQSLVREGLAGQFQDLPRRRMRYDIDMSDLEDILSLPAWKRRYELYSAWILTLLLKALAGHQIQLHHDKGRLAFAFRETVMASVLSAVPPLEIYSERWVALANPVGHGRSAGAQPDYSLWTVENPSCPLAVECKHYKRSSTRNFSDALSDYAAALTGARIILTNYGPVRDAVLDAVAPDFRSRCTALGHVHPEEPKGQEEFRQIVRKIVGEPRPRADLKTAMGAIAGARPELLVVDISGSMSTIIDSAPGRASMTDLISQTGVRRIATVDDHLVAEGSTAGSGLFSILSKRGTGSTDLGPAVRSLLQKDSAMLVLTDDEGIGTLSGLPARKIASLTLGSSSVSLLLVGD
jgi:hypothetical protein